MGCGSAKQKKTEIVEEEFRSPPSEESSSVDKVIDMPTNSGEEVGRTVSVPKEESSVNYQLTDTVRSTEGGSTLPGPMLPGRSYQSSGMGSFSSEPTSEPNRRGLLKSPQPQQLRTQTVRSDPSNSAERPPDLSRMSLGGGYVESVASRCSEYHESICSDTDTESSIGTPRLAQQKRALPQRVDLEDDDIQTILTEAVTSQSSNIEINHHSLETLPGLLMQCSDWAQTLCASHNVLVSIPPAISTFSLLTKLSLSHNELSVLPPEIGSLENLTSFDVSYNRLSSLPPSFASLTLLKRCILDFNRFVEFPHIALEIKGLERLYIAENHDLNSLPKLEAMQGTKVIIAMDNAPPLQEKYSNTYLQVLGPERLEWNKIYPDKVLDFLYIGSLRSAQTPKVYETLDIGFVVTCGKNMQINQHGVQRLELAVEDVEEQSLRPYFEELHNFIETNKDSGSILVHCFAGLSRSATMILSYLMKAQHMRLDDALQYLVAIRPNIHPNEAFMKELIAYDSLLAGEDARTLDYELIGSSRTIRRIQMASGNKNTISSTQKSTISL